MARKLEVLPPTTPLLPSKTNTVKATVFSEKRQHINSRNIMVSFGVSRMGKTRVVYIHPGVKVNSSYYWNIVLVKGLLPDTRAICRHCRWTLQQDGAPVHTARTTMDYLKKKHINFIEPHMWPPNCPDINPVDYATVLGRSSATSLQPTTIQDGWRTEASDIHWVTKTLTAFHW